jgi:aspartyl protease family protein
MQGTTSIHMQVCRVDRPNECREVKDAIVDTGAAVSAIPERVIEELGIELSREHEFTLANGEKIKKKVGTAIIRVADRNASDSIVAIPNDARPLLGVRALEEMGFRVDPSSGRLIDEGTTLLL